MKVVAHILQSPICTALDKLQCIGDGLCTKQGIVATGFLACMGMPVEPHWGNVLKPSRSCWRWTVGPWRKYPVHLQKHKVKSASVVSDTKGALEVSRRMAFGMSLLCSWQFPAFAEDMLEGPKVRITPETAPDQSKYDPTDPDLRASARLLQDALGVQSVEEEERLWTKIIDEYGDLDKNWVPDLVGRAWGNRGNARSRMGKLDDALADYNKAIELCPWAVDPVLNRGVVYEAMGRFQDAVDDYQSIIAVDRKDPAAWNNLGNAYLGMGEYKLAAENYGRAVALAPKFAFASANRSIALFQLGQEREAIRNFRTLLRKYPDFPDVRAALVAGLWKLGMEEEAETEWTRVEDPRYRDRNWLEFERRWPPALVNSLDDFLELRDPKLRLQSAQS